MAGRTTRAIPRDNYLLSLPIYPEGGRNTNSEGASLLFAFGVEAHRGGCPPSCYVPPQSWWFREARAIIRAALAGGAMLFHRHAHPYDKLSALVNLY